MRAQVPFGAKEGTILPEVSRAQMAKRAPHLRVGPLFFERFPGPLHRQLHLALREQILCGDRRSGERLPSSRALARELGISRNTVLAAYDALADEGFVLARVGSGTRVNAVTPRELSGAPEPPGMAVPRTLSRILERSRYPLRRASFHDADGNTLYIYDPRQSRA